MRLLELGEGGAELVDGGVGDGLPHRLVDLLPHVRRHLLHYADSRPRSGSRSPGVRIVQHLSGLLHLPKLCGLHNLRVVLKFRAVVLAFSLLESFLTD